MIYGYDSAIQLPVKDLYDSQIMLASINAARDMYEKGEQAIKDFNKEYGDFFTPITKDLNWYNENVTGAAKNLIDSLYEQGIDPTRSIEGRAAISKFIRSVDKGLINKMKTSSEFAKEYLKSKQLLEQKGLYNPEFQKWVNNGYDLDNWFTGDGNIWNRVAATPYEDLTTFSKPQYDQLKPSSWTFSKNGMTYRQKGIRQEDLDRIAQENFEDFVRSQQGSFLYNELLKKNNNDKDAAKNEFNKMIAGSQRRLLFNDAASIDDDWFKLQDLGIKKANLGLQRQRLAIEAAKDSNKNNTQMPLSYTERVQMAAGDNMKKRVLSRMSDINGSATRIRDYYKNLFDAATDRNAKDKYKKAYDKWSRVAEVLPTLRGEDLEKAMRKYYITDKDGNFTSGYTKVLNDAWSTSGSKTRNITEINNLYDMYRGDVSGVSKNISTRVLAGSDNKEKFPEGSGKYYSVTFGRGLNISNVRRANVTGSGFTNKSISNEFNKWARRNRLKGYLVDEDTNTYFIPKGKGELDVSGTMSIPMSVFDKFIENKYGQSLLNDESRKNVAKALGFTIKDYQGKEYKVDDELRSDTKYVVWIPVTRTTENNGLDFSDIDTMEDKTIGGSSTASKRQYFRQDSNLNR